MLVLVLLEGQLLVIIPFFLMIPVVFFLLIPVVFGQKGKKIIAVLLLVIGRMFEKLIQTDKVVIADT